MIKAKSATLKAAEITCCPGSSTPYSLSSIVSRISNDPSALELSLDFLFLWKPFLSQIYPYKISWLEDNLLPVLVYLGLVVGIAFLSLLSDLVVLVLNHCHSLLNLHTWSSFNGSESQIPWS